MLILMYHDCVSTQIHQSTCLSCHIASAAHFFFLYTMTTVVITCVQYSPTSLCQWSRCHTILLWPHIMLLGPQRISNVWLISLVLYRIWLYKEGDLSSASGGYQTHKVEDQDLSFMICLHIHDTLVQCSHWEKGTTLLSYSGHCGIKILSWIKRWVDYP